MKANGDRSNYHGDRGKEHVKKGEKKRGKYRMQCGSLQKAILVNYTDDTCLSTDNLNTQEGKVALTTNSALQMQGKSDAPSNLGPQILM